MYRCFAWVYVCSLDAYLMPIEVRRERVLLDPSAYELKRVWSTMWVLGTEPGSSGRATDGLCWISRTYVVEGENWQTDSHSYVSHLNTHTHTHTHTHIKTWSRWATLYISEFQSGVWVDMQGVLKWKFLLLSCDLDSHGVLLRQDPWEDTWCLERV